jgi:hypothetical protein
VSGAVAVVMLLLLVEIPRQDAPAAGSHDCSVCVGGSTVTSRGPEEGRVTDERSVSQNEAFGPPGRSNQGI